MSNILKHLAEIALDIRERVLVKYSDEEQNGYLNQIFQEFRKILSADLSFNSFADIFAPTLTYTLFSLRIIHSSDFHEKPVSELIPSTSPIIERLLQKLLSFKSEKTFHNYSKDLGINRLFKLLTEVDLDTIISEYEQSSCPVDLIVLFYEEFLKFYNPSKRIRRGVFYTPDSLVSFIVRSIDIILKFHFELVDGLANESSKIINGNKITAFQILDPTTGTGIFLSHIIDKMHQSFQNKYKNLGKKLINQKWNIFVNENLLPRIFGIEILITPYIIAHLNLGARLKTTGYNFTHKKRLNVFLDDTLKGPSHYEYSSSKYEVSDDFFLEGRENTEKNKGGFPIGIILGNPPYQGHSTNRSPWIEKLLHGEYEDDASHSNYFEVDGEPLGEKNPKWLNDDYVRFIRFGQWRIEKAGYGVLAFITNHSYLDNPTFRGMRQQLMKAFTDVYILDLHGNLRKKEKNKDFPEDENIFDIQQGICISFFIKNPQKQGETEVFKADLWGSREQKKKYCETNDISTVNWKKIKPFSPWYFFYDLNMNYWKEYKSGWKITDIFSQYSVGIMTGLDKLTIQNSPKALHNIVRDFLLLSEDEMRAKYAIPEGKRQWAFQKAKTDILNQGINLKLPKNELETQINRRIVPILYRPFDTRFTFYTGMSRGFHERPRGEIMDHMLYEGNLGLIVSRNSKPAPWRDIQITQGLIELGVMATRPGNNAPIFPLFCFEKDNGHVKRRVNFTDDFQAFIKEKFSSYQQENALGIVYYIYAILHSKEYRKRYENFLKIDFPKIPFTLEMDLFVKLTNIGKELVQLHLMKSEQEVKNSVILRGRRDGASVIIRKISYTSENVLKINDEQYFDGISREIYDFYIGSYRVCRKWLSSQKGRVLSETEIQQFYNIVNVIIETIKTIKKIDSTISEYGDWSTVFAI
ncbi:MAG: type ISP restriction/modification enzyme [Candidatus Hodarchaeales archaeon]|jgi:predicted helicase